MKFPILFTVSLVGWIAVSLLVGCGGNSSPAARQYPLHGKVVEVSGGQLKIDHEAIPGYMGAMQMTFPVSKAELLHGLQAGDHVHGQLTVTGGQPIVTELSKD